MRILTLLISCFLFKSVIISNPVTEENDDTSNKIKLISSTIPLQDVHLFPRLGFGTAGLFDMTYDVVSKALHSGFKMIDTAQAQEWYNEKGVGDAVKQFTSSLSSNSTFNKPTSITIVTKIHPRSFEYSKMFKAVQQSMSNLLDESNLPIMNESRNDEKSDESTINKQNIIYEGSSSLDVVLLHSTHCWPDHCTKEEESIPWSTGWRNLEQMKHHGLVKYIGVSNFDIRLLQQLQSMADYKVAVIQNWMDPFHQDKEVREYCHTHGIVYMAYSSFGTQWSHFKIPNSLTGVPEFANPVFSNAVLKQIGEKHGLSIPQVVISWLLQSNVVAIPRSSKSEHIHELKIFFPSTHETDRSIESNNNDDDDDDDDDSKLRVFLDNEDMTLIDALDGTIPLSW